MILLVFCFCILEYYSVSMHCVPIWIFISSAAVDIFIEVTTGLVEHITSSNISRSKRISYFLVLTGHFSLKCVNLPHPMEAGVASPQGTSWYMGFDTASEVPCLGWNLLKMESYKAPAARVDRYYSPLLWTKDFLFDEVGATVLIVFTLPCSCHGFYLEALGRVCPFIPPWRVDEWVGDQISGAHYVEVTFHQPL